MSYLRRITVIGTSEGIVLPPALLKAMGWQRGDYLQIVVMNEQEVRLVVLNPTQVTDAMLRTVKPEPVIKYG